MQLKMLIDRPLNMAGDVGGQRLRIDNRRESVIRATLHCSLSVISTISYHIPNDSLYFCLSNHINDMMIDIIFREL